MIAFFIILGALILVALTALFMIFPALKRGGDIDKLSGLHIAHRGLHDESLPENSLPAFRAAVSGGYAIEIDIHITKDDRVVVFHDHNAKRMCGKDKKIEDMTLLEIKQLRLCGSDMSVPSLEECLDVVKGEAPLMIEFKAESIEHSKRLCKAANQILKDYKGLYFVQSFYPFVLSWYRKNAPHITRGQLAARFKGEPLHKVALGLLLCNFIARPHFISYEYKNHRKICLYIQKLLGAMPICWTLRSKVELNGAKSFFKAYIFENFIP